MDLKVESVDHGTSLVKKRFSAKKVLFVIDDVDDVSQVCSIVEHDSIGAGSRIILTTRDEHLLDQYGVDTKYKVRELSHHDSLRLFSCHAFKKPYPPKEYVEVSHEMTTYAGGLPLALIVLGSKYLGRTVNECKSAFRELRKIPPREIQKKLELSYESLSVGEQDIFLDVACFFIGMDKHYVTDILDDCCMSAEYGIRVLQDRSLLAISEKNILSMHDLLHDMGREIVCRESPKKPGQRSRLWSQEDVLDVLRRNEALENLKILDVSHSENLETTPNMSRVPVLTTLLLEGCTSLSQIHPSIGVLEKLLHINLKGCKKLRSLPHSICRLRSVEILNLTDCSSLEHLPNHLFDLIGLKELLLDGTAFGIQPSSIGAPDPPKRTSHPFFPNSSLNGSNISPLATGHPPTNIPWEIGSESVDEGDSSSFYFLLFVFYSFLLYIFLVSFKKS